MIYVDDMYSTEGGKVGRMKMSHMIADTTEELLDMVDKIGVDRKWVQFAGTAKEHFDISKSKRMMAVNLGAKEISRRELSSMVVRRRMISLIDNYKI